MNIKDNLIKELELEQIISLDEIVAARMHSENNLSFFIDTMYHDENELPIYPATRKVNLTHNLLNLFGTHWCYFADKELNIRKQDGDLNTVLDNIKVGNKTQRFACYAFAQKYLKANKSLWLFVPEGKSGWYYQNQILIPQYKKDLEEYERLKKS